MNLQKQPHVWIIGFPKSGNTWVSYLFSYLFNLKYHDFGDPKRKPQNPKILMKTKGKNPWSSLQGYVSIQKTHKSPQEIPYEKGLIIYVIRDPRDVFVSYNFFMKSKHSRIGGRLIYFLVGLLGKKFQINWFLYRWNKHLIEWKKIEKIIIDYDKLLNDGGPYLIHRLNQFSINVSDSLIFSAIEYFKFENISGGRKSGQEDNSSFFRKGISGDWKNHLSLEEEKQFKYSVELYKNFNN